MTDFEVKRESRTGPGFGRIAAALAIAGVLLSCRSVRNLDVAGGLMAPEAWTLDRVSALDEADSLLAGSCGYRLIRDVKVCLTNGTGETIAFTADGLDPGRKFIYEIYDGEDYEGTDETVIMSTAERNEIADGRFGDYRILVIPFPGPSVISNSVLTYAASLTNR